jgi:hypothetical protein
VSPLAPRRIVYTALMGRYEQLNEQPIAAESDVEFVCFTDDPDLRSSSWTIRLMEPRFPLDSIRSARYLKARGPSLLTEYDETLWIDNAVQLRATPESLLGSWLATADIGLPLHSFRTNVISEFDAVVTEGYDDPARVYEQLIHYSTLRPETLQELPYWTALVARRQTPEVDAAMRLWWDHLLRYSRRDQLSINYVVGSTGLVVNGMPIDNMSSDWHEWPIRVERKWNMTQDRMANALRVPTAEIGRLSNSLVEADLKVTELLRENQEIKLAADLAIQASRSYQASNSWRITAPLRALSKLRRKR